MDNTKTTPEMSISPNIRVAMYYTPQHPYQLARRVIFDYELLYLEKGTLTVTIEDRQYSAQPGDILLIKPSFEHSFYSVSPGRVHMPHLHFDMLNYDNYNKLYTSFKPMSNISQEDSELFRPDILSAEPFSLPEFIRVPNHKAVLDIMLEIISLHRRKDYLYGLKEKELFIRLIHTLVTQLHIQNDNSVKINIPKLKEIRDYIDTNLKKKIKLDELARQAVVSPFHLERLFKKYYGNSILRYQKVRRMEAAVELMLYSGMSLSVIAQEVGYSDIHSFSKTFKKYYGMSPSQYIKNAISS